MKTTRNFQKTYAQLNPQQKKAVDTIDGPVMVVAGPGTGKTQVLAARVANILQKTDTNPNSILALTFTDSAAKNMRKRLVEMIGRDGYYVHVQTFHSFCQQVLSTHPEYFPINRDSEALTDLERYDLFSQTILDLDLEVLKPLNSPLFYLREIMKAISDLKKEGFLPDDFEKVVAQEAEDLEKEKPDLKKTELNKRQKNLQKQQELVLLYSEYQKRLRENLRYDFDDMISLVVEAFSKEEMLLREYQENLLYFLVDEYQDTNAAQNKVVDLLASYWDELEGSANIFVVGDPNQAIYRFQGASIENVLNFVERYPKAKIITLDVGYRCPEDIYKSAAQLIENNQLTEGVEVFSKILSKPLTTEKKVSQALNLYNAPSQTLEVVYVAEEIKKLVQQGVKLDEISILYRHNRDAAEVMNALEKWGFRYEIDGGDDLLENEQIRQLLNLLQVISDVQTASENIELFELMSYDWSGLDQALVMKLGRAAGKAKLSIVDLLDKGLNTLHKHDLGPKVSQTSFGQAVEFVDRLKEWGRKDANLVFPEWFELVVKESGFLDWILEQPNKVELLTNLNSLFREVKALSQSMRPLKLEGFLSAIAVIQDHKVKLRIEDLNVKKSAIHLSTVHRAKGREWDYVFLIHCFDGKWGNNTKRKLLPLPDGLLKHTDVEKKELNEDERRLFYVAVTRAKKQVYISYPETFITDSHSRDSASSMFIEELGDDNLSHLTASYIDEGAEDYLVQLMEPKPAAAFQSVSQEEFLSELVADFKLSVTALNKYLSDPENFVTDVLLKVPRAKEEHMAYGTAVHVALEKLYQQVMENQKKPPLEFVLSVYKDSLTRELLTSKDFERRLTHGEKVLKRYYDQVNADQIKPLFVERFFGFGWSKTMLGDITLTGRIDRVDWIDIGKKTVRVIDYKTGKPKSANHIEGKTKSAGLSQRELSLPESIRGSMKRQLLFYKLLTELDRSFIPTVEQGVFDFVEPSPSGNLVQRHFTLKDSDVEDLKELIKVVMGEIRGLEFLKI